MLERENVRNMDLALVPEPCGLAVIDVSFISLTLVLPRVRELLREPLDKPIVALVKPQFEVGRDAIARGGVVRDEVARRGAVTKIRDWAEAERLRGRRRCRVADHGPGGQRRVLVVVAHALTDSRLTRGGQRSI